MELDELKNILIDCNKQLDENDWREVERTLNCNIPFDLKEFYNRYNGGKVKGDLFLMNINGKKQIKIRYFIPVKYNKICHDALDSTMEGKTLIQRSNPTLGADELITGITWNGDRICVNAKTGIVMFYPVIGFNNDDFVYGTPIFISDSFHEFFSMLQYEPEELDNSLFEEERTSKKKLYIEDSANQLSSKDWLEFEKSINFSFPATMKKFYKENNGGMPNLYFFLPQGEDLDEVEIKTFLPIKYHIKGVQTIEETSKSLWDRNMISKNLLPFAIDSGNNLYAIHNKTLCIYYIVMDMWHDEWTCEENFEANSTKIASSFRYFITHLLPKEE